MSATLRSLVRRLTGPTGRRSLALLLVAGLWAAWEWLPAVPRVSWSLPDDQAFDIQISPDGTTIATAAVRIERGAPRKLCGPVRLWDTATGRQRARILDSDFSIVGLGFAPDGSWLWTSDDHRGVRVWDPVTRGAYPSHGHDRPKPYWTAAVSPDSRLVAAAFDGREPVVHVWQARTGRPAATLFGACHPFTFTPDSQELVTATTDTDAKIWDLTSGQVRATLCGHTSRVGAVAVSPDGRLVASGLPWLRASQQDRQAPTSVKLFDLHSGAEIATIDVTMQLQNAFNLRFSPHGDLLVIDGGSERGLVWDVTTTPPGNRDDLLARTGTADGSRTFLNSRSLWFSPDGSWWLVRGGGKTRHTLLKASTSPPPAPDYRPHGWGQISRREFAPDGRTVATIDSSSQPAYTDDLNGLINRLLRRPVAQRTQHQVSLLTLDSRRTLVRLPQMSDACELLGYGPGGQTFWTADLVRPSTGSSEGIRVIRGWTVPSGWPPAWLFGATMGALALVVADWRRGRRRGAEVGGVP